MKTNLPIHEWVTKMRDRVIAVPMPGSKFPNIPLTIPEVLLPVSKFVTSRMFLFNFMVGFLLMAMVIVGKDIQLNSARLSAVEEQRQHAFGEIASWENVVHEYPGYRDGYYQLALLQNQVGDRQAAYELISKALQIDPDFTVGKQFIQKLVE